MDDDFFKSMEGRGRTPSHADLTKSSSIENEKSSRKVPKEKKSALHDNFEDGDSTDPFIKFSDLVFFYNDDTHTYFYGEGVKFACVGHPADEEISAHFANAVFRLQPKYEYAGQKDLNNYAGPLSSSKDKTIKRLEERATIERKQNELEERSFAGKSIFYGQILQLSHFATNMYLAGSKRDRAETEVSALKISLDKDGSKNCWFKIMPKFKVRFEGEAVRKGDQVVFIHVKSGQFVHLSEKAFEHDAHSHEINLFSSQSGWNIHRYAPYIPETEKFVSGGDVLRIFHQEAEGFVKANITPLYDRKEYQIFIKTKGKKTGRSDETKSSNTMWQIETRSVQGGLIPWNTECRFKHQGTGKYIALSKDAVNGNVHLMFTRDFRNLGTIFTICPVDQGSENYIPYGSYFRLKHAAGKEKEMKEMWLHVLGFIQDPRDLKEELQSDNDDSIYVFHRDKFQEIIFEERFQYQDVMLFKSVERDEVDALHYVSTLYSAVHEFVRKIKPHGHGHQESMKGFSKQASVQMLTTILEVDVQHTVESLGKLILFLNEDNKKENPLEVDGLPIPRHQTVLFEQQFIEMCVDILFCLFGNDSIKWRDDTATAKKNFEDNIVKEENKHLKVMVSYIYKLFELVIKENKKIGLFISKYLNLFLQHIGVGLGVRRALVELFRNNSALLNNIPEKYVETFSSLLLVTPKNTGYKLLEFWSIICMCEEEPVFKNQNWILDRIEKYGDKILMPTHYNHSSKLVTVLLDGKWIPLLDFVRNEKKENEGERDEGIEKKKKKKKNDEIVTSTYPYNKNYLGEINFFKVQLELYHRVASANDAGIVLLAKKAFHWL